MKKRSVLSITLSKIIGLAFFFFFLWILNHNILDGIINQELITFLNQNIWIVVTLSIIFYFGELFYVLDFPLNVVYPLFNVVGSVLLIDFIFSIIYVIDEIIEIEVFTPVYLFKPLVYLIVPLLVIIVGYMKVYESLKSEDKQKEKEKSNSNNNKSKDDNDKDVEWNDVGNQFKLALYNIGSSLKNNFDPKKKK
jgi:hypothetical protein